MPRTVSLGVLDRIHIAAPCPVRWEDMQGDDRTRHCRHCDLNVYNLSAMTRDEAERLITSAEGRLCGAFFRRQDGTILTRDCPRGLAAIRRRAALAGLRIAAAVALLVTGSMAAGAKRGWWSPRLADMEPFSTIRDWMRPAAILPAPPRGQIMLGEICPPPPVQPPPAGGN